MRPCAAPRTAAVLVCYIGLVGLIGLVDYLAIIPVSIPHPPAGSLAVSQNLPISSRTPSGPPGFISPGTPITDITNRDKLMKERWSELLAKPGFISGSGTQTIQAAKKNSPKLPQALKYINSNKNHLILPAVSRPAAAHLPLLRLATAWKGLVESFGLVVTAECWGYSGARLWVKLAGRFPVRFSGACFMPSIQPYVWQVTFIQPFKRRADGKFRLTGLLPFAKPGIPLKSTPASIKPIPLPPEINKTEGKPLPAFSSHECANQKAKAAIIIDDIGYHRETADELVKIQAPLTWAILPFAPCSKACLEAAKAHGCQVILHLPLEPLDCQRNPGPGTIKREWTRERILRQLDSNLQAVPDAVGINNHMGSAGTRDERLMEILMAELKQRELFFVDSMTDACSVAGKYADISGVPFARRRVFIDNAPAPESQRAALRELIRLAVKDGAAIGITHARPASIRVIAGMLPEFEKAGVELVPVAELVR